MSICAFNAFFYLLIIGLVSWTLAKRHHVPVKLVDVRNRVMLRRMGIPRDDLKPKICYDLVGCFVDPPPRIPLKRPPEHPNVIQTRFFLYTRQKRENPENLEYGDDFKSILSSRFDAKKHLKVFIHGYKGSGSGVGAVAAAKMILDLEDANVIILDWTRGAGTTYSAAVANTELVGRQLALVISDMINLGTEPKYIHIMGFSLGAHVAGCASEVLKKKNFLLGRITGIDPASPFFRHHLFRERSRKLDVTDAQLVDVIHTDGSENFADGFGLLKPIGHIDFFPNGGRQQPGCIDVKNSVVVSHFKEDLLDLKIACSHVRGWQLFAESIKAERDHECKFIAWPCPQGAISYVKGTCFPMENDEWSQKLGYTADKGPLGIYYLPTRGEEPFCGLPLRASVRTAEGAPKTSGSLFLKMIEDNSTTMFKMHCDLFKRNNNWSTFYNIAAGKMDTVNNSTKTIKAAIWYEMDEKKSEDNPPKDFISETLMMNKLTIEDRKGNRWEYCNTNTPVNKQEMYVEMHNVFL